MRSPVVNIEQLESRTLFSAAPAVAAIVPQPHAASAVTAVKTVIGPTLHLTAGTPFSGQLGFYATPVLDPPDGYSATINWGDGTVTKATLTYGENGTKFGEIISGTHAYAKAGTYAIKVTFVVGPIDPASTLPTKILEYIDDKAIVAARHKNSAGGLTIHPILDKQFTAEIGTFSWPAPATGLTASINWGDGTSSVGVITATGVQGLDVINFKVTGSHTYTLPGDYSIVIKIAKPTATAASSVLLTIYSTAEVAPPVAVPVPVT